MLQWVQLQKKKLQSSIERNEMGADASNLPAKLQQIQRGASKLVGNQL